MTKITGKVSDKRVLGLIAVNGFGHSNYTPGMLEKRAVQWGAFSGKLMRITASCFGTRGVVRKYK